MWDVLLSVGQQVNNSVTWLWLGAGVGVRVMTFKQWMQHCGNLSLLKEVAGMQREGIGGDRTYTNLVNRFQEYHCINLNLLQTLHIGF
jgi:hypothetical protein